jgi:hypothetical protein
LIRCTTRGVAPVASEPMTRRERDVERLAQQRDDLPPGGGRRGRRLVAVADHHVEVGGEGGHVGRGHVDVAAQKVHAGRRAHPPEQAGQQHPRARGKQRHPDEPTGLRAQPLDGRLGPCERGEHPLRLGDEGVPGVGEAQPSPRRLGERHADLLRERLELLRDGRRGEREGGGDGRHRAAVGELAQNPQPLNVHEASLKSCFRTFRWSARPSARRV